MPLYLKSLMYQDFFKDEESLMLYGRQAIVMSEFRECSIYGKKQEKRVTKTSI